MNQQLTIKQKKNLQNKPKKNTKSNKKSNNLIQEHKLTPVQQAEYTKKQFEYGVMNMYFSYIAKSPDMFYYDWDFVLFENTEKWFEEYFINFIISYDDYHMSKILTFEVLKNILYDYEIYNEVFMEDDVSVCLK